MTTLEKVYLSRRLTRTMAAELPVGDPFGGAAFGERRDPVSGAIIGGSVLSGYLGNEAAEDAAHATSQASNAQIGESGRQFDLVRQDTAPAREVGQGALYSLADIFGVSRGPTAAAAAADPQQQPLAAAERAQFEELRRMLTDPRTGADVVGNDYEGPYWDAQRARYRELLARSNIAAPPTPAAPAPGTTPVTTAITGPNAQGFQLPGWLRIAGDTYAGSGSSPADILASSPSYQFRLGESEKALERMQAARRYSLTPRAATEIMKNAQGLASEEFDKYLTRRTNDRGLYLESLFRLSGTGGNAVNTSASAGAASANQIGAAAQFGAQGAANAAQFGASSINNAVQGGISNYLTLQSYNDLMKRLPAPASLQTPANAPPYYLAR